MRDLLFVLGTVAFFAAMLLYIRGCEALGRNPGAAGEERTL
jgi:hypothetical protein